MSEHPIVADVRVREHKGHRITRITVIERGTGPHWPTRATSVPPSVRERDSSPGDVGVVISGGAGFVAR